MKKILALLIACCLICLTGCGEKIEVYYPEPFNPADYNLDGSQSVPHEETVMPEGNQEETVLPEIEIQPGININEEGLVKNFKLVCKQVGINPDKITEMQYVGDWDGGPAYSFVYEGLMLLLQASTDDTVEVICVNGTLPVFDRRIGAHKISNYILDSKVLPEVESLAESVIRESFGFDKNEPLPLLDCIIDRNSRVYDVIGSIMVSESESQYFVIGIEVSEDVEKPTLRCVLIGEDIILDDFDQVKEPEMMEPIAQNPKTLYSGTTGFLLSEGDLGECGKKVDVSGSQSYIDYLIDAGTYTVTSKSPECMIWITSHNGIVTQDMLLDTNVVRTVQIHTMDAPVELTIQEGEHIILSYGAKAIFEPM